MSTKNDTKFDVRVTERYLRKGVITQKELDDRINALPDAINKGVRILTGEALSAEDFKKE